jgi:phenylalanine-4-hydroxylase
MKYLVIASVLLASFAVGASLDGNGNLVLSRDEVANTQAMFNELQRQTHYQRIRIEELEKMLIEEERRKCV